jgi:hypothetical protein
MSVQIFKYTGFIDAIKNPQISEFLRWFTKTQLFEMFIANKCNQNLTYGVIFEDAIKEWKKTQYEHSEKNSLNESSTKLKKIKQISKLCFRKFFQFIYSKGDPDQIRLAIPMFLFLIQFLFKVNLFTEEKDKFRKLRF